MRNFNNILIQKKAMTIPRLLNTNRKVLGITWCMENDTFVFDFKNLVTLAENLKPTKRNILQIKCDVL